MTRVIERMLERWEASAARGEAIEINQEMMRMAMGVIAATMFNIDITEEAVGAAGAFTHVLDYITANTMRFVDLPLWVPTPGHRRFNDATRTLNQFMGGIIRARREAQARGDGPRHNDLLDMLINAKDEETGQSMSDKQIYDEVLTIFFAGHETTAQALTWTWHLLSQHPEAESRLHADIDATLGGRTATADDLAALPYPRQVIDEAMRLYPPVWIFVRDAYGDDEIGGYTVPAKSMIMLSPYLTHRHPGFWEEPDQFDPERFAPERAEKRHHYAYFPFGGGARTCIGNSFALLEAHLAVAMIAQRFRLRRADDRPVGPKMLGTLRPDGPVMMRLEPRHA